MVANVNNVLHVSHVVYCKADAALLTRAVCDTRYIIHLWDGEGATLTPGARRMRAHSYCSRAEKILGVGG